MEEYTHPECEGFRIAPSSAPASRGPAGDRGASGMPLYWIIDRVDHDDG